MFKIPASFFFLKKEEKNRCDHTTPKFIFNNSELCNNARANISTKTLRPRLRFRDVGCRVMFGVDFVHGQSRTPVPTVV